MQWKSPWDWPGFEVLTETSQPLELYSRKLDQLGAAVDTDEARRLRAGADAADRGAILTRLRSSIDAQGNKDGKVDGDELRKALRQPWLAESITKLTVKYDSEWAGPMDKWDEIDSLMLDGRQIWTTEKMRITRILFWAVLLLTTERCFATNWGVCEPAEKIVFNCKITNERLALLCYLPKSNQFKYKFVSKNKIELQISESKSTSRSKFIFSSAPYAGGGESHIKITNNKYMYFLFDKNIKTDDGLSSSSGIIVNYKDKKIAQLNCANDASIHSEAYNFMEKEAFSDIGVQ